MWAWLLEQHWKWCDIKNWQAVLVQGVTNMANKETASSNVHTNRLVIYSSQTHQKERRPPTETSNLIAFPCKDRWLAHYSLEAEIMLPALVISHSLCISVLAVLNLPSIQTKVFVLVSWLDPVILLTGLGLNSEGQILFLFWLLLK